MFKFFLPVYGILYREVKLIFKDKCNFLLTLFNPVMYLLLYSTSMSGMIKYVEFSNYRISFMEFILPGILIMTILFNAMKYSQSIFNEQIFGMGTELFSTPINKTSYIVSKISFISIVGTLQSIILFCFGTLGFKITYPLEKIIFILLIALITSVCLGSFFIAICIFTKTVSSFVSTINIVVTLLLFSSSIFYPTEHMHSFLKFMAYLNPLTYAVTGLRELLFTTNGIINIHLVTLMIITIILFIFSIYAFKKNYNAS